jgi:hypothetical protein
MLAELEELPGFGDGRVFQIQRGVDVKVILSPGAAVGFSVEHLTQEALDLGPLEACECDVEIGRLGEFIQQFGQLPLVPFALNLVERDVESLLLFEREVDDADLHLRGAGPDQHLQALVAADEVAGAPVPDQRFD